MNTEELNKIYLLSVVLVFGILSSALGYFGYQNYRIKQEKAVIEGDLVKTKVEFAVTSENLLRSIDSMRAQAREMLDNIR